MWWGYCYYLPSGLPVLFAGWLCGCCWFLAIFYCFLLVYMTGVLVGLIVACVCVCLVVCFLVSLQFAAWVLVCGFGVGFG